MKTVGTMLSVCLIVPGGTAGGLRTLKRNGNFYQQATVLLTSTLSPISLFKRAALALVKANLCKGGIPDALFSPMKLCA